MVDIPVAVEEYLAGTAFRSNPNLRPAGTQIQYTEDMVLELIKCKQDPCYFISTYIHVVHPDRGVVKMELYEYQKRMVETYHNNRRVIFLTARQQGKCLVSNTLIKLRNKSDHTIIEVTMADFYVWKSFNQNGTIEDLQAIQRIITRIQ